MSELIISTIDVTDEAARVTVTVTLVDGNGRAVIGETGDGEIVVPFEDQTDEAGELRVNLIPNAEITRPTPTYYRVTIGARRVTISKGSGSERVLDAEIMSPAPTDPAFGLVNLADVELDNPTAGQILVLDVDGKWRNVDADLGGGTGIVETIVEGSRVNVDATDPANPIVAVDATGLATTDELAGEATARTDADALLIPLAQRGAANGVATLDAGGKVPAGQYAAVAISDYLGAAASEAAMLALDGERGDWCTRTDTNTTWILVVDGGTLLAHWKLLPTPTDAVSSVDGQTGAVSLAGSYDAAGVAAGLVGAEVVAREGADTAIDARLDVVEGTLPTLAGADDRRFTPGQRFRSRASGLSVLIGKCEAGAVAATAVLVMDSYGELGVGGGALNRMQRLLNPYSGTGWRSINGIFGFSVQAGTDRARGLNGYSKQLNVGQVCSHAFTCDAFDVYYRTGVGSIEVRDVTAGTLLATVDTSSGFRWQSGALTYGTRTVSLTGAVVNGAEPYGVVYHVGTRTSGLQIHGAGHTGWSAAAMLNPTNDDGTVAHVTNVQPDLILYGLGINDYVNGLSVFAADHAANLVALRAAAAEATIVVIIPPAVQNRPDWSGYADALFVAGEAVDALFVDLFEMLGTFGLGNDPLDVLDGAEATHLNVRGTAIANTAIFGAMLADYSPPADRVPTGLPMQAGPGGTLIQILPFGTGLLLVGPAFGAVELGNLAPATTGAAAVNLTQARALRTRTDLYGDGSDGPLVNSGTLNLARDMQWTNVSGTGTINTNGWRVMISGTLSGTVTINHNGAAAIGTAGGLASTGWYATIVGGAGGTTTGNVAGPTTTNRCLGGTGGTGGTGSSGAGGATSYSAIAAIGTGVAIADIAKISPRTLWNGRTSVENTAPRQFLGGAGGGGGGGDGTAGGGGGAGGGVCCVFAYDASGFTGSITANGGAGAAPAAGGNRGGGAGGGGGYAGLITSTAPTGSYTLTASAGAGAAGTGTGTTGANGSAGNTATLVVS